MESLPSPAGEEMLPGTALKDEMLGLPLKMETMFWILSTAKIQPLENSIYKKGATG